MSPGEPRAGRKGFAAYGDAESGRPRPPQESCSRWTRTTSRMRVSAKRDAVELGRERHAAAPENRPGRRDRRPIRRARVRELGGLLRLQQAKLTARQVDRLADELFGHVPTLGAARRVARTRRFAMSGRVSDHRRVTPPGEMPLQIQEAERLGHNGIGCEHLLLGILAEEGDAAAKVLSAHGVTLDGARSWTDKMVGDGWQDSVRWIYSPRANLVRRLAEIEAERLGQAHLGLRGAAPSAHAARSDHRGRGLSSASLQRLWREPGKDARRSPCCT